MKNNKIPVSGENGFSLIEVVVAMTLLMVAVFGVFATFTFAVSFNTGNSLRSQCLAVSQQEIEVMRSAKFTALVTDQTLTGGTKTPKTVTTGDGNKFQVQVVIDDDPSVDGIQIDPTKSLKEITVTATSQSAPAGWQTAVPTVITLRRVRGN